MTMSLMELKELLAMDSISKKGNIITVRKGFFYTRGRTVHDLIVDILLNFPAGKTQIFSLDENIRHERNRHKTKK